MKTLHWGLLFFGLLGCTPSYPPGIPRIPVEVSLYVFDPQFVDLQGVGGYAVIPGGSKGILVYRVSMDQFNAYELHCPGNHTGDCGKVSLESNGFYLTDVDCPNNGCGSRFNIITGGRESGTSQYPLVRYNTAFDGVVLRVFD
jgi:hypothetical protein